MQKKQQIQGFRRLFTLLFLSVATNLVAQTPDETAWFEGLSPEWKLELQFSMERIIGNPSQYRSVSAKEVAWISDWKGFFFSNYSPISDLTPIARLKNVERLNMNNMPVKDISAIKTLNLYQLSLNFTKVESLAGLEGMTNLEKLDLAGTNVKSLKPLYTCKNLEALDVRGTPLQEKDLIDLQKQLPDCVIWYKTDPKPIAISSEEAQISRRSISTAERERFSFRRNLSFNFCQNRKR